MAPVGRFSRPRSAAAGLRSPQGKQAASEAKESSGFCRGAFEASSHKYAQYRLWRITD